MSTNIPYLDEVWNLTRGCTKVSAGCKNCYAERLLRRFCTDTLTGDYRFDGFKADCPIELCDDKVLDRPLHWRKPRRVGVCFVSDLFHEKVPDEFLDKVFAVMALTPQHTYMLLTKRPERMREYLVGLAADVGCWPLPTDKGSARIRVTTIIRSVATWPLPNVWLGVSVENQQAADERIPLLLETPAAHRWLSVEPLLEAVDLPWLAKRTRLGLGDFRDGERAITMSYEEDIDWVVVGGESGPKAREMDLVSLVLVMKQCEEANVPAYCKQDSGPRPGMQGRIPDALWAVKQLPEGWA